STTTTSPLNLVHPMPQILDRPLKGLCSTNDSIFLCPSRMCEPVVTISNNSFRLIDMSLGCFVNPQLLQQQYSRLQENLRHGWCDWFGWSLTYSIERKEKNHGQKSMSERTMINERN
ncbi:hypothetical protein Pfo_013066, partial [Paulownia fortunei]